MKTKTNEKGLTSFYLCHEICVMNLIMILWETQWSGIYKTWIKVHSQSLIININLGKLFIFSFIKWGQDLLTFYIIGLLYD